MAVIVALLHDVLDDTSVTYEEVEDRFGPEVAEMVKKVSRLSSLNQLLRRKRRQRLESSMEVTFTADAHANADTNMPVSIPHL